MSYVTSHLLPNERIEHLGKTTFLYVLPPLLGMILFIIIGGVAMEEVEEIGVFAFVVAACFFISFIVRCIISATSEFAITNKRVILKRGFISIKVSDIALDRCDGVSFDQGFWGRLLGYGIVTTGSIGARAQKYPALAQPGVFRNALFLIMEKYKNPIR